MQKTSKMSFSGPAEPLLDIQQSIEANLLHKLQQGRDPSNQSLGEIHLTTSSRYSPKNIESNPPSNPFYLSHASVHFG